MLSIDNLILGRRSCRRMSTMVVNDEHKSRINRVMSLPWETLLHSQDISTISRRTFDKQSHKLVEAYITSHLLNYSFKLVNRIVDNVYHIPATTPAEACLGSLFKATAAIPFDFCRKKWIFLSFSGRLQLVLFRGYKIVFALFTNIQLQMI